MVEGKKGIKEKKETVAKQHHLHSFHLNSFTVKQHGFSCSTSCIV